MFDIALAVVLGVVAGIATFAILEAIVQEKVDGIVARIFGRGE